MKPNSSKLIQLIGHAGLVLLALCLSRCALADDHHAGFDNDLPSWKVRYDKSQLRLLSHRRNRFIFVRGSASENLEFIAAGDGQFVELEQSLPHARVFDELKLSLWFRSNRPGAAVYLRVVFPHQIDPATGKLLFTDLPGETYTNTGRWQRLTCTTPQRMIDQKLRQIRARLRNTPIDPREAYVERVFVTAKLSKGTTEFFLDELNLGPIVAAKVNSDVMQVAEEGAIERSPFEFRLNRLRVEGAPFFPRVVPYHNDPPQTLNQAGANVVWVPRMDNSSLINELHREGLWSVATPPRHADRQHRLQPFGDQTRNIMSFMLGMQIPADAKETLVDWKRQIEDADRRYRRPIMADVTGLEHTYSRHVDMLGVSRFPIGSSLKPKEYRDWLIERRKTARPGSFIWTWVQTEMDVSSAGNATKNTARSMVVEPEQIRLLTYAAIAAGCRGVGYWKKTPLNSTAPGAMERKLAITQLNLELELLEPWLATGTVVEHVPFRVSQRGLKLSQRAIAFQGIDGARSERNARLRARDYDADVNSGRDDELEATIIRTDYGMLLLPVWYHRTANYAPSQMAANDATIVVRGAGRAASAWEVTTTGIRSLEGIRITGGIKLTIPRFDQTAAIILTSDRALINKVRHKIADMAQLSSRTSIDMIRAKLERVRGVDAQLEALGVGQLDAPQLLARATQQLASAERAFQREDYHGARQTACEAAQSLRILQSAHWYDAIRSLSSPAAGPYTVNFQSLPDHWRMMAYLGRTRFTNDSNILPSGDFEDIRAMIDNGWKHAQNDIEGVKAAAELYPLGESGGYALRLVAVPDIGRAPPRIVDQQPVTVTTPPLAVTAGQMIHVSGRVRIIGSVVGSQDGVMLYDSQSGPQRALRWNQPTGWRQFELLRKVEDDGDLSLTIALTGLGEAQFDNIRVVPHSPRHQLAGATAPMPPATGEEGQRRWDFIPRIPKWSNPLPGIQKSIPRLENPIPRINDALPKWDRFNRQAPVPRQ